MAKSSRHLLSWSQEHQRYELSTAGHRQQCFGQEDQQSWQVWLSQQTSFAFQGQHGHISVLKETRSRGAGYWYAYSTRSRQTTKRYLGPLSKVTLDRLEEIAQALATRSTSASRRKRGGVPPSLDGLPSPAMQSHMSLVASKQVPPQLPPVLVQRERLLHNMDAVFASRLLVLSAAAGSGKTTLLSSWATCSIHAPKASVWLSLDELDNDPTRFWTLLVTALRSCVPTVGEVALRMLRSPHPPLLSTMLTTLLNELLGLNREIVLILDDYQVIKDPDIHESLHFWLDHLPSSLHMVLSSRVDPALPLARWRVRGQLVEIHDADLRFTLEEATSFLTQAVGRTLSEETMVTLGSRTEGWIAGLQLAALALRKRDDLSTWGGASAFNHRYLLEYVQQEILQPQPLAVQNFLLQTSVLTRLNSALCQAVTGAETPQTSQEMLDVLERDHLFLLPLDEQRQWYRFHELFRTVLLARLQASQPHLVPLLHQRAARWYEEQGLIHETMAHALAASDYAFAASVLEREAEQLWMHGEAKMISTWVMALPDTILHKHLDIALLSALKLLDLAQNMPEQQWTEARTQSTRIMARLEHMLQNGSSSEDKMGSIGNRLRLLHGLMDMRTAFQEGNIQEVRRLAYQLQPLAVHERAAWKKIPLTALFLSAHVLGDVVLLLPDLLTVKQQALQEQDRSTALVVSCWLAGTLLYAGHLRSLQQECLHIQALLEHLESEIAIASYPDLDLAFLMYAWNQLDKAEASLHKAIRRARHWQDMTVLVWSYSLLVKVFLAAGKLAEAEQALQEIRQVIQETEMAVYASEVMAAQVSLWLAHGDLSAAGAWATHFLSNTTPSEYLHAEEYLALTRVYLAQQQYASCLRLLTPLLSKMEAMKRQWDVIQILALQVVALHACGEVTQVRHVIIRLLTLTEPEGFVRVYLDAGEPMQQVLKALLDTLGDGADHTEGVSASFVSMVLSAFEQKKHNSSLPQQAPHAPQAPAMHRGTLPPTHASSALIEPLSPREEEVLRLLAEGATNQAIADRLVISLTTVKKHVGSLLMKLTAENRTHAVARAREWSLL